MNEKTKTKSLYKNSNAIALIAIGVAALVLGALMLARWLGVDLRSSPNPSGSSGSGLPDAALPFALGLSAVVGLTYGAWRLLRAGLRTLSKDVRAGSEEARLEADILRARLAELEQRLDEKDSNDEGQPEE